MSRMEQPTPKTVDDVIRSISHQMRLIAENFERSNERMALSNAAIRRNMQQTYLRAHYSQE